MAISYFNYVISDYRLNVGIYGEDGHDNLTNITYITYITLPYKRARLPSGKLCLAIATDLISFGKWIHVGCDEPIEMPYVICENSTPHSPLSRKINRKVLRADHECHKTEVLHKLHKEYKCLSLKSQCALSALRDTAFPNNTRVGFARYLSRWAMGLTFTIGYKYINSTHGECLRKLQACCYDKHSEWEDGNVCERTEISHWRCVTESRRTTQSCSSREFQCVDRGCVLNHYRCDNIVDCLDESDEANCTDVCTKGFDCFLDCGPPNCTCHQNYLQYETQCVPLYQWYHDQLSIISRIVNQNEIVRQHIFTNDLRCPPDWALCAQGFSGTCYPNENICVFERTILGHPLHCGNTEHLAECHDHQCPTQFKCLDAFCIPIYMLCDGVSDCPDQEDEDDTICMSLVISVA